MELIFCTKSGSATAHTIIVRVVIRATVVVLGHTTYPANKVLITVLIPTTFFWVPDNDKAHDTTAINAFPVSLFSIVLIIFQLSLLKHPFLHLSHCHFHRIPQNKYHVSVSMTAYHSFRRPHLLFL